MPKLFLDSIHFNQYIPNSASAYIYHGTHDVPLNHEGQALISGDPFAHVDYLQNEVLPELNKKLKTYQAVGVDLYQGCITPLFVMKHRNGGPLDLEKIKMEINKALNEMNRPRIKPCMFGPVKMNEDKQAEPLRRSERLKKKG